MFSIAGHTDKFEKIWTAILTYATRLWYSKPRKTKIKYYTLLDEYYSDLIT